MDTNTKSEHKSYMVNRAHVAEAKRRAERRCRESGEPITWRVIIREILDATLGKVDDGK